MCNCGNTCGTTCGTTCGNSCGGLFGLDSQTIIILLALWFFFCQGGNLCGNNNCGSNCGNSCGNNCGGCAPRFDDCCC